LAIWITSVQRIGVLLYVKSQTDPSDGRKIITVVIVGADTVL